MSEKSRLALNAITAILRSHPDREGVLVNVARILCRAIPDDQCIPAEAVNFLTRTDEDGGDE